MEKRKSLSIRQDRYSRRRSKSSCGSGVLNPDTNNLGDEYPFWWRNLENTTIARLSTDSANFNQTSRRLNSNSSINENDIKDGWWKVLQDTPADSKFHQKNNDPSEKDTTINAPAMSESDEEDKVKKMRPPLRSIAKKAKKGGDNPFLDVLKNVRDSKQQTTPSKRKPLRKGKRFSFATNSSVIAAPTNPSKVQNSWTEYEQNLSTNSLPKASSTLLENSSLSRQDTYGNSNSDTEHIVIKPKSKLLRRHNRDKKKDEKNLFEDVLFQKTMDKDADRTLHDASTVFDEAIEERELQIEVDNSKPIDTNGNDVSETLESFANSSYGIFQSPKPKSRFLRGSQKNPRENVFQKILDDSDSSTTIIVTNSSEHKNVRSSDRRSRVISTESNSCSEEVRLRLSDSTPSTNDDKIRSSSKKSFTSHDNDDEVPSSQPPVASNRISADLRLRSVLPKEIEKGRRIHSFHSEETENDENANVAMRSQEFDRRMSQRVLQSSTNSSEDTIFIPSNSQNIANRSQTTQSTKSQLISAMLDDENVVQDEEASPRRSNSLSRLQKGSISLARNVSEAEQSTGSLSRRQSRRSATVQERKSAVVNDEKIREAANISPRRSMRSEVPRITSEAEESVSQAKSVTKAEQLTGTSSRRQSRRLAVVRERSSVAVDDEKIGEVANILPRRSMRSEAEESFSPAKNVAEAEQSTGTSSQRQSRRSAAVRERSSAAVRERSSAAVENKKIGEVENTSPRRSMRSESEKSVSPTKNVTEAEQSTGTSSQRQSRRSAAVLERSSAAVEDKTIREIEKLTLRRILKVSLTRIDIKTAASGSSSAKQTSRVSEPRPHVVTPVKENEPDEVEGVAPKRSLKASRIREDVPTTIGSQSQIEDSQSPARKQSRRTCNVEEHHLTLVTDEEPIVSKDIVSSSQEPSTSGKHVPLIIANESVMMASQYPAKRRSKRTSKTTELVTPSPAKVNQLLSISQSQRSSIFSSQMDGSENEFKRPSIQSRRKESKATDSETAQTPTKKRSKLVSNAEEQTVPIAATAKETKEADDTGQRRSRDDSKRRRKAGSTVTFFSDEDSETENEPREADNTDQAQSSQASKRKSKSGRVRVSDSRLENVEPSTPMRNKSISGKQTIADVATEIKPPIEAENIGQRRSRDDSKKRRKAGSTVTFFSDEDSETENEPREADNTDQAQSSQASKRKSKSGRVRVSDSRLENVEPSTPMRNKSISGKQTIADVATEIKPPIEAENIGQRRSRDDSKKRRKAGSTVTFFSDEDSETENEPREADNTDQAQSSQASKRKSKSGRVRVSDSRLENVEPSTPMRNKSISGKQTIADVATEIKPPIEAENIGQRQSRDDSRRQSKPRRIMSLLSTSDSEQESDESPRKEETDSFKKKTESIVGAVQKPIEALDNTQRRSHEDSRRQSKPRRIMSLLSTSDSEQESDESPRKEETDSFKKKTESIVGAVQKPIEALDNTQRRSHEDSRRQSKPRRIMSLLSTSDSEQESDESPRKEETDSFKKKTESIVGAVQKPIEALDNTQRRNRGLSWVQSKPQTVTSSLRISDSKTENVGTPTMKRHERTSAEQTIAIAGTSKAPIEVDKTVGRRSRDISRRQSEPRRVPSLLSSSDSDLDPVESPKRRQGERSISLQRASVEQRRRMKQNSIREASQLVFTTAFDLKDHDSSEESNTSEVDEPLAEARETPQNLRRRQSSLRKSGMSSSKSEGRHVDEEESMMVSIISEGKKMFSFKDFEQNRSKRHSYAQREESLSNANFSDPNDSFVTTMSDSRTHPRDRNQSKNDVSAPVGESSPFPIREAERVIDERLEGKIRVATKENVSAPKERSGVKIRSIESVKIGKRVESTRKIDGEQSWKQSSLRTIIDCNTEPIGLSVDENVPGTSRTNRSLRAFSSHRFDTESDRERYSRARIDGKEKEARSGIEKDKQHPSRNVGRNSNVGTGLSRAKSSAASQMVATTQRHMEDFFKSKTSATKILSNVEAAKDIRNKLDELKKREIMEVKKIWNDNALKPSGQVKKNVGKVARSKKPRSVLTQVNKAFLVKGQVYKQPRLPRPMKWVTDRLYRFLWKRMQPTFQQETRMQSEKFVRELCEVSAFIARRKSYVSYKTEMYALMKEMARLEIICTRHDFYNFCYDFLPYELRVKMVPMLLPGNQRNIPYDPEKLHMPLLDF